MSTLAIKRQPKAYNLTKYQILAAVLFLEEMGMQATTVKIRILTQRRSDSICKILKKCTPTYIISKGGWNVEDRCVTYCKATKRGRTLFNMLADNHARGLNLKISKHQTPEPYDYSDFVLLPGLEEFKEMYGIGDE